MDTLQAMLECASLIVECRRSAEPRVWGWIIGELDQVVELWRLYQEALK